MKWAWQLSLKPANKLVLMALADSADDKGVCWPSISTLAKRTCMDERSVQRNLKNLKEDKLIEIKAQFRNDGSPTSNKYKLSLKESGDNLSSQSIKKCQGVVGLMSPADGVIVTQTTIKPLINQKQQELSKIPAKNTEAVYVGSSSGGERNYYFPKQLSLQELEIAKPQLDTIDPVIAQAVLDELSARLNANKVTGAPLSYLRSLIARTKTGQFIPEVGVRVAAAREQAKLVQLKKAAEVIKPSNPSKIPKHLAAMHEVLNRKSKNLNQKD